MEGADTWIVSDTKAAQNLWEVLLWWPQMSQMLAGSSHSAYGWGTPRSCCTAACTRRRCGCPGSPPPQWRDLMRGRGNETYYFEMRSLSASNLRANEYFAIKTWSSLLFLFTYGVERCHVQATDKVIFLNLRRHHDVGPVSKRASTFQETRLAKPWHCSNRDTTRKILYQCQYQFTTTSAAGEPKQRFTTFFAAFSGTGPGYGILWRHARQFTTVGIVLSTVLTLC